MFKLKIKLESLLYNNDEEALDYLRFKNINIDEYDQETRKGIVNEIELEVREDYSIDYLLKKLSKTLMNKIDYQYQKEHNNEELKTCVYCFADRDLKKPENVNKIILMDKNMKINKIRTQAEIDAIDVEEDELSEIDFDSDEEELSDIDMDELSEIDYGAGGGGQNGNKILMCNNCKKCYFYNKYFDWKKAPVNYENFRDIFPFPELIYLRNETKKLSFNLIDNQRKELPYEYNEKNILSPYNHIKEIEKKFFKQDKKNGLYKYLDAISLNDGKEYKYIYNTSYMLLNNFNYENLTMSYFPEICLFKKNNQYKSIELYSKLYYPNINFANYYLKFLDNIPTNEYIEVTLRRIQLNKRQIDNNLNIYTIDQIMSEKYGENEKLNGWGIDIENKEKIDQEFDQINAKDIEISKYINKINYKVNSTRETNSLINFSLIFHLFQLDEETPFISSYLPEEGVMLEKYYRPLKNEVEKLNLVIKNKKIIRFLTLLPKEIMGEKKYFYIHLYENLKVEVTISISNKKKVYINQQKLLLINDRVNSLLKKLNNLNIFNFSDIKIPLSSDNFEEWNNKKNQTDVGSINLNFEIPNKPIEDIHNQINNISQCFNNYFIRDYNYSNNDYRYIKINNINLGVLTDRYIYYKIEAIKETNQNLSEDEISNEVIKRIMSDFQKNFYEAKNIYKNYLSRYKQFQNDKDIIPINYGVFFNIKKDNADEDKDNKYIINVFGLRDYNDIRKMEKFMKKIFYILNNPKNKNVKEIFNICQIINQNNNNNQHMVVRQNLILLNQKYRKCINQYNTLKFNKKKLKGDKEEIKKIDDEMKEITKNKKKIRKSIERKESTTKHIKSLKQMQNVFNNLKFNSCSDKNIKQYTKRCQAGKQPMGTGNGVYEEVIDWNKDLEQNRLNNLNDVTCSLEFNGVGGSNDDLGDFTYLTYMKYWNKKYTTYKGYDECYIEINNLKAKGKKKIQNVASNAFEIDSDQKQIKVVLELIKKKILENVVNQENYKIYLNKIINLLRSDGENPLLHILKEYYQNDLLQTYDLDNSKKLYELSEYLFNSHSGLSKYLLFKAIIEKLNEPNQKYVNKDGIKMTKFTNLFVEKFNLKPLILLCMGMKDPQIKIRHLIIYIINKIFKIKEIKIPELQKIFTYLSLDIQSPDLMYEKFNILIQRLYDTYLVYHSNIEDIDDDEVKENLTNETSLNQLMSEVKDLIIRKDENNQIIDSVINYKGKALTCPNYSEQKDNKKSKPLIGFLDISKFSNKENLKDNEIRDLVCQPCCFGQKYNEKEDDHIIDKRYRKNMLFCKSKIDWKNYLKLIENETRIDGYVYSESVNINTTFGYLPKPLFNLFNNFVFLLNQRKKLKYDNFLFQKYNSSNRVLKQFGFCKKGYDQKKNVIFTILEDILNLKKNIIISDIEKKLNNNPNIFKILNEGKLSILFKNISNYIAYLESDIVDINWIVDILKYPGIFKDFNRGINIILFKKNNDDDEDSDINIIKYKFIDMIDYFDSTKNIIFIFKHFSGELEPIILKKNKLQLGIFKKNMTGVDIFKNIQKKHNIDITIYFNNFIDFFNDWIKIIFKNNYFSSKKLIKKFNNIKLQLIDNFYKVNYLIDNDLNLIPIIPSEVDIEHKFEIFNNVEYFENNLYLKNLKDTIDYMKHLKNKLNDENYLFQKVILDDKKKFIVGIELRNNLIVPVIPLRYKIYLREENEPRISSKFLYFNINNILFNNQIIPEEIQFIKEKYDLEIYQRFILEFSHYLNNNNDDKITLSHIIENDDKKRFSDMIFDIVGNIVTFKEDQLINYKKISTQKNNIRVLCNVDQNFYCDKNKLIIPFSKKNFLIGLFIESIINNEDFRLKIFNSKMTNIIDINKYIDDDDHVYNKKEFIF